MSPLLLTRSFFKQLNDFFLLYVNVVTLVLKPPRQTKSCIFPSAFTVQVCVHAYVVFACPRLAGFLGSSIICRHFTTAQYAASHFPRYRCSQLTSAMYVSRHTYCAVAWHCGGSGISPHTLSHTVNKLDSIHSGCKVYKPTQGNEVTQLKTRPRRESHGSLKKVLWLEVSLEKHTKHSSYIIVREKFDMFKGNYHNYLTDESIHLKTIVEEVVPPTKLASLWFQFGMFTLEKWQLFGKLCFKACGGDGQQNMSPVFTP